MQMFVEMIGSKRERLVVEEMFMYVNKRAGSEVYCSRQCLPSPSMLSPQLLVDQGNAFTAKGVETGSSSLAASVVSTSSEVEEHAMIWVVARHTPCEFNTTTSSHTTSPFPSYPFRLPPHYHPPGSRL